MVSCIGLGLEGYIRYKSGGVVGGVGGRACRTWGARDALLVDGVVTITLLLGSAGRFAEGKKQERWLGVGMGGCGRKRTRKRTGE